ncbi:hypothetical protein EC991_002148 [Linnemannia zychae]|nr:hypothetical protein EC991_002148 [Linnemannia zychae]
MYTRGAFGNWRGRGRGQEESPPVPVSGQSQGWGRSRGATPSDRGGYSNWRGHGGYDSSQGESSSWGRGRGSWTRGGFDTPQDTGSRSGGRGYRGRGGFDTPQDTGGWSGGRGFRGRGGFHASRGGYGSGWGRDQGGGGEGSWEGYTHQERAEIMATSRNATLTHISSDGTDDLIVPATTGVYFSLANEVLENENLDALSTPIQMEFFLQSCLAHMSNHHTVDTSWILSSLASEKGIPKLHHIMLQPVSIDSNNDSSSSTVSFQKVTVPLIGLLTRQNICQSVLTSESNIIYALVHKHNKQFLGSSVLPSVRSLLDRDSSGESLTTSPSPRRNEQPQLHQDSVESIFSLPYVLLAIVRLFYQVLRRFPESAAEMGHMVEELVVLVGQCLLKSKEKHENNAILSVTLRRETERLSEIVNDNITSNNRLTSHAAFNGPGERALHGTRHDNDHTMISKIAILPTRDEILCRQEPYLPITDDKVLPTHFLPKGWRRHLDDHFRLYRQDMLDLLRTNIQAFVDLLNRTDKRSDHEFVDSERLARLLGDNLCLNVYNNVQFSDISTNNYYPGLTKILFDQPLRVQGLDQEDRQEFWEQAQGRLMRGSLVCMVRRLRAQTSGDHRGHCQVILAVVQEREITGLSESDKVANVQVLFTDPTSYSMAFTPVHSSPAHDERWFLIECPGSLFERYRSVLKALQSKLPATLPFGKYIVFAGEESDISYCSSNVKIIDPPLYTTDPGFKFDLSVLLKDGAVCDHDVHDGLSADRAKKVLREHSSLDDGQVAALVDTLGREFSLIYGPPGTGKSKIGAELMKVLLHNKQAMNVGPILVICYTNHALDQFLEQLLDANYTKIARLGSQSKSQRLQDYNLKTLMMNRPRTKPHSARRVLAKAFQISNRAAKAIRDLTREIKTGHFSWRHVKAYLKFENPEQCHQLEDSFGTPEAWEDDESETPSTNYAAGKHAYARWITGKDLEDKWSDTSHSDRPLSMLGGDVWSMSLVERHRLLEYWSSGIIQLIDEEIQKHHQDLKTTNEQKFSAFDEHRRLILSSMDVIGMTTNSAAKYQALLESVGANIVICEEAGEVLECHILAALSPCTQQVILIGDHQQLRPYLQTSNLSSESAVGKKYNLDRSLFERLVTSESNPLPISRLSTQYRMGSEISSLIRNVLYPTLEDDFSVSQYPDISGMCSNLFFMNHNHLEDKGDPFGAQSFFNTFEVEMVEALALHLANSGYDQPGDIVILSPYLGQLAKIHDHLQERFVVQVDARDEDWMNALRAETAIRSPKGGRPRLEIGGDDTEPQRHISISTIDNIQGEEAKIVIVSLVRSNVRPGDEATPGSNGFLESPNRTNVLLTRAQQGLFLIGNAAVTSQPQHGIWPSIMRDLERKGRVGPGFPIICKEGHRIACCPEEFEVMYLLGS